MSLGGLSNIMFLPQGYMEDRVFSLYTLPFLTDGTILPMCSLKKLTGWRCSLPEKGNRHWQNSMPIRYLFGRGSLREPPHTIVACIIAIQDLLQDIMGDISLHCPACDVLVQPWNLPSGRRSTPYFVH